MTWGWSGRNTVTSTALLHAPTHADRRFELETLEELQSRVRHGEEYVAQEKLSDYKAIADQKMYDGFRKFLLGDLRHLAVEGDIPNAAGLHQGGRGPLVRWRNAPRFDMAIGPGNTFVPHLLHIPGAHNFCANHERKIKQFETYLTVLYEMGPQTLEQAWHYYKFIAMQQKPTTEDIYAYVEDPRNPPGAPNNTDFNSSGFGGDGLGPHGFGRPEDDDDDDDSQGGGGGGGGGGGAYDNSGGGSDADVKQEEVEVKEEPLQSATIRQPPASRTVTRRSTPPAAASSGRTTLRSGVRTVVGAVGSALSSFLGGGAQNEPQYADGEETDNDDADNNTLTELFLNMDAVQAELNALRDNLTDDADEATVAQINALTAKIEAYEAEIAQKYPDAGPPRLGYREVPLLEYRGGEAEQGSGEVDALMQATGAMTLGPPEITYTPANEEPEEEEEEEEEEANPLETAQKMEKAKEEADRRQQQRNKGIQLPGQKQRLDTFQDKFAKYNKPGQNDTNNQNEQRALARAKAEATAEVTQFKAFLEKFKESRPLLKQAYEHHVADFLEQNYNELKDDPRAQRIAYRFVLGHYSRQATPAGSRAGSPGRTSYPNLLQPQNKQTGPVDKALQNPVRKE